MDIKIYRFETWSGATFIVTSKRKDSAEKLAKEWARRIGLSEERLLLLYITPVKDQVVLYMDSGDMY